MNLKRTGGTLLALSFLAMQAGAATTVTLDTGVAPLGYNFPLGPDDNGGGMSTTVNGVTLETFCVDFANNINEPYTYQAYVTTIESTSDLSNTRFGNVTSWADPWSASASYASTLDNANALARYQMAAYLVSTYNVPAGNVGYNEGIQQAIWEILDPTTSNALLSNISDATDLNNALSAAATWYSGTTVGQRNAFLSNYEILSDPNMSNCTNRLVCASSFQEQIVDPTWNCPEPRGQALMMIGLLTLGWALRSRIWKRA